MRGVIGVGLSAIVLAVLMVRVRYLRVPNWPNTAIMLLLLGSALLSGALSVELLGRGGVLRVMGGLLSIASATAFGTGLVAIVWVPARVRGRFGAWDALDSHPWLRRTAKVGEESADRT